MIKFKAEIQKLIKNVGKIPEQYWQNRYSDYYYGNNEKKEDNVVWFMDRQKPSVSQSYDFDVERFGLTRDGKVIWGFDSGCSCPSAWEKNRVNFSEKTWKEFVVEPVEAFDSGWDDECYKKMLTILKEI